MYAYVRVHSPTSRRHTKQARSQILARKHECALTRTHEHSYLSKQVHCKSYLPHVCEMCVPIKSVHSSVLPCTNVAFVLRQFICSHPCLCTVHACSESIRTYPRTCIRASICDTVRVGAHWRACTCACEYALCVRVGNRFVRLRLVAASETALSGTG